MRSPRGNAKDSAIPRCCPFKKGRRSFPKNQGRGFSVKSASNLMRNDTLIEHLHYFGAVPPESQFSKLLNGLGKDWLRGVDLNQRGFGLRPSLQNHANLDPRNGPPPFVFTGRTGRRNPTAERIAGTTTTSRQIQFPLRFSF